MGQKLRVTVAGTDHAIKLLNIHTSVPDNAEIEVEWCGETLHIIRNARSWIAVGHDEPDMQALAESIGKALALRYRF